MNESLDIHESLGQGAECIMKNALHWRSLDNVTIVIVAFNGFKHALDDLKSSEKSTPNAIPSRGYKMMGPQSVRSSIGGIKSVWKYHWDHSQGLQSNPSKRVHNVSSSWVEIIDTRMKIQQPSSVQGSRNFVKPYTSTDMLWNQSPLEKKRSYTNKTQH